MPKKGYKQTAEHTKKINIVCLKYWNGKKRSTHTKQKISRTLKGHSVSAETRQKISNTKKGQKHSEEHKRNISIACKGIKKKRS
ncbi:MAG: hypothetical protein DRO96_01405 [Candidatus Aenigmatarchaeota archaeon]|nr:MAG: hypothetical protein DRO96_01405 [Candidatus Aenigmarchaeota archaeon]